MRRMGRAFKVFVHLAFIVIAAYLYISVVLLWAGRWKTYFMRSGNIMYYIYLLVFTWIYVQIIKLLWKWQVRLLSEL